MNISKTSSVASVSDLGDGSTWVERLLLNLISYCWVLGPMALIVLATRYRLWPTSIQSSALIQRFVYGSIQAQSNSQDELKSSKERLLIDESQAVKGKHLDNRVENSILDFIWCFVGLQMSYLVWGLLQEKIMTTEYPVTNGLTSTALIAKQSSYPDLLSDNNSTTTLHKSSHIITFHDSQFLVFINRIIAFILSILALVYNRPRKQLYSVKFGHQMPTSSNSKPQAPLYEYVYCSLSNILSSWCQYEALKYVDFPTQVLSKSCKIIPVMLMSKIMLRKRYKHSDYFFALLLSLGMFVFLMNQPGAVTKSADSNSNSSSTNFTSDIGNETSYSKRLDEISQHVKKSSLISGLVILAFYLAFDSFTSNWQQSLFARYGVSKWQMMAATNFYSIVLTLTSLHQLGSLKPAFQLLSSSTPLLIDCLLMSIMSSVGQLFVFYTINRFGSVIFAVIMTLRQFIAILLSCAIYGHRLTWGSCVGLLIVFCVIALQMWRKSGGGGRSTQNLDKAREGSSSSGLRIQFKPQAN